MLKYKKAELIAQVALLLLAAIAFLVAENRVWTVRFIVVFAIIQLTSMIGHGSVGKLFWKSKLRRFHLWGTWLVMLLLLIAFFKPVDDKYDSDGIGLAIIATFVAAFLAVLYLVITTIELNRLTRDKLNNPEQ